MMEELDFDEEILLIHPEEDTKKIESIDVDANSTIEQASESDSGEIEDDEEANDLEEGEIKDSSPVTKKKSDIACRFFKRGSCVFGSQCQYLHVSDTVYKMFDTNPQRRNNMQPKLEFPKPIIFPPIVLPPRPFIEPPILLTPKAEFPRPCDTIEDNWEKGLEQARILIRKANLKKKNEDSIEPKKINSNISKGEKTKGQYFTKANVGSELNFTKKYGEKTLTNNNLRRQDENKSNFRYQSRSSDKWVDPWRRSKSPLNKKRSRSLSGSSPSRSRKHSYASSTSSDSSSSSDFDSIYGRPYERKSSRSRPRSVSRSRSISQSRQPKKRRISPKRPFVGRRNMRSNSRSLSRSPYRKRTFSSHTRSRSSSTSSSSCSDCQEITKPEDKEMKRISDKLNAQFYQKSPERASSLIDSDCETSELTVSSASCTPVSSDSETESPRHSPSLRNKSSLNRNNAPFYSNKSKNMANHKAFGKNQPNSWKNKDSLQRKNVPAPAFQKKTQPRNNGTNPNNQSFKAVSTNCKPTNTASSNNSVKKPAPKPAFSKSKLSDDMALLFSYQGLRNNNSKKPNNPIPKPNKTVDSVKVATNNANGNSESTQIVSKAKSVPKQNIVLNLKPKSNKPQGMVEVENADKKEAASKREQLLNKLKLIDDAIARKKASNTN